MIDSREVGRGRPLLRPARRARRRRRVRRRGARGRRLGRGRRRRSGARSLAGATSRAARAGCSPPTTRWPRCRRWRAPGGASSAARWSGSPARSARPRSRTSAGRCCRGGSTPARENFNTEIGLPLTILEAPAGDRGRWCWRWRCAARARSPSCARSPSPTSAVITNVGPVHVELLGSVEAIAAAKAEILAGLPRRRHARSSRPTPGRWSRTSTTRSRRCYASAPAATSSRVECRSATALDRGADRHPGGEAALPSSPSPRRTTSTNALAAIASGVALEAPLGRDGRSGAADNLLAPARRAGRARRRNRPGERLLQRQPGLDARGARPPRLARRGRPPHRGARRDGASSGPTPPATTARSARTRAQLGVEPDRRGRRAGPRLRARRAGRRRPRRRPSCSPRQLEPGDAVLVKGSRSVGLERSPTSWRAPADRSG